MEAHNVIIIGSWPAGYTAWIYASRAMLDPLLFEWFMAGGIAAWGQLTTTTTVYNYPWFPDGIDWPELMLKMRKQALNQWVEILTKTVDCVDFTTRPFKVFVGGDVYLAKSVILATWAVANKLWVPWEDEYWQRWISTCAICDWGLPMYRNKRLLVVWWWDAALEEAAYLTKFASEVCLLVRRDVFRGSQAMQQRVLLNEKIKILWNTEVVEALWDGKQLQRVKAINNKTNEKFEIECAWLFYAVWHKPNTDFLVWQVELDENWYVKTVPWTKKTSIEWVFAAWDVMDFKFRQAVVAAWTGCMAAMEAERYLRGWGL